MSRNGYGDMMATVTWWWHRDGGVVLRCNVTVIGLMMEVWTQAVSIRP